MHAGVVVDPIMTNSGVSNCRVCVEKKPEKVMTFKILILQTQFKYAIWTLFAKLTNKYTPTWLCHYILQTLFSIAWGRSVPSDEYIQNRALDELVQGKSINHKALRQLQKLNIEPHIKGSIYSSNMTQKCVCLCLFKIITLYFSDSTGMFPLFKEMRTNRQTCRGCWRMSAAHACSRTTRAWTKLWIRNHSMFYWRLSWEA